MLGGFRATWCGESVDLPGRRLVADLWIYLLLHRELPLPIGRLLGVFWPDIPEQAARANLRRYLHFLGQALPQLPEGQTWYHRDREHVLWNARAPLTVDLDAFERVNTDARECMREGDPAAAEALLERIAAEFGGELLPDHEAAWLVAVRDRHRSQLVWSMDALTRLLVQSGQLDRATLICRRLVAIEPQRQASRHLLLWVLHASGQVAAAVAEARALTPDPDAGAGSSSEFRGLRQAILEGKPVERWQPAALRAPAVDGRGTIRETVAGAQGRLPLPGDRFVGRLAALAELRELLAIARQVTLTGMGGAGKTRLALELARTVSTDRKDGCWWVDLTAVSDPRSLDREVSTQLGLKGGPGIAARDRIVGRLAASDGLLVLDNCEQVLAAAAELARTVLAQCPQIQIVATSRERLAVPGEVEWPVPALQVPADGADMDADLITAFEAPELFLVRVREQWPDFRPDALAVRAIARICRLVEGIPLAIELAAARISLLDVADIARRLEQSFAVLRRRDRAHPERHETLDMAIDWGYQLLLEDEQVLLARLAVFSGGFTLAAAQAVCGGTTPATGPALAAPAIESHLHRLRDKSFLVSLKTDGGRRFLLPEMIRQFSLKRLAERGEEPGFRERHAEYQVRAVEAAEPHLRGPDAQSWLDLLDEERGNMEAAMVWILQQGQWSWAYRLSAAAGRYWYLRGHVDYEREWLAKVLAQPEPEGAGPIRARSLYGFGLLAYAQGDFAAAAEAWSGAADIWRRLGDLRMVSLMVDNLGRVAISVGDLDAAKGHLNEAVAIRREMDDGPALAASLNVLAELATRRGEYTEAAEHFRSSLDVLRRTDAEERRTDLDNALCGLANVMLLIGSYDRAQQLLDEALARCRSSKHLVGLAGANYFLGRLQTDTGAYDAAAARYAEALALRRKMGFEAGVAWVLHSMGELELRRGRYPIAGVYLNRSLETKEKLGDAWNAAFTRVALAELACLQGKANEARAHLSAGLDMATRQGNRPLAAQGHRVAALIHLLAGEPAPAAASLAVALASALDLGEQRSVAVCLDLAARLALAIAERDQAMRCLALAADLRERIGAPRSMEEQAQADRVDGLLAESLAAEPLAAEADVPWRGGEASRLAAYQNLVQWLRQLLPD
ncbi:MAG: tetratricopeptide repeat protein [Ardenticatenia bacterium]|nr:tetratricopeptide repeat protein [Ardenticatenia bacterium]